MKKTPLYEKHLVAGARMVDFAGWQMPLHYGSQVKEHKEVRNNAGMFDVSHMTILDLRGENVKALLLRLLTNSVEKIKSPGMALYGCMLKEDGGIIDDLITYHMSSEWYRLVVNAATREKDVTWIKKQAEQYAVEVTVRDDLVMIAVQGPNAQQKTAQVLSSETQQQLKELRPFRFINNAEGFFAYTGYTGEAGYELIIAADEAPGLWQKLLDSDVVPCGLGARDTLRLEAGMSLYGTDMNEQTTPLETGLGWTVAWTPEERDFLGRDALEKKRLEPATTRFTGIILCERGLLRNDQDIYRGDKIIGRVSSGGYSPTLERAIGLARVDIAAAEETSHCEVIVRNKRLKALLVKPPFVRQGKSCLESGLGLENSRDKGRKDK